METQTTAPVTKAKPVTRKHLLIISAVFLLAMCVGSVLVWMK